MLYLLFFLDNSRYVIKATDVIEIVPLVKLTSIPRTPDYVAGIFNYRGKAVPVIDMRHLVSSASSHNIMSTRIIMVNYNAEHGERHVLGLLVEHVTDMIYLNEESFDDPVVRVNQSLQISQVLTDQSGIIQKIEIGKALPEQVRNLLFLKDRKKKISEVT